MSPKPRRGSVRHLALASALAAGAVVLPPLVQGQWKGALLGLAAASVTLVLLVGGFRLLERLAARPGPPRSLGALPGCLLSALAGLAVSGALVASHAPHAFLGAALPATGALAAGLAGHSLRRRVGGTRFLQFLARLGLALLGSMAGGFLGLLGPRPWAVDAGILAPLALFAILAASGRLGRNRGFDLDHRLDPP